MALLASVLAVDPEDRPQSAAALRAELGRVIVDSGHGAVSAEALAGLLREGAPTEEAADPAPAPRLPSSIPPPRRSPAPWIFGAVALVATLTLGALLWHC